MGRDRVRYPDPDMFKPERWIKPERQLQSFDEYEFPVFQGGPRICPGKDLAFFEIKILITELLRRFRLEIEPFFDYRSEEFRKKVTVVNGKSFIEPAMTLIYRGDLNIRIYKR